MSAFVLIVNGTRRQVEAPGEESLLAVLRDRLQLTGTKYGCGEGSCGACTVHVDGRPIRSCRTRAEAVAGLRITTIEGLEHDGRLHPVQEAFLAAEAFQCGYCTPGMILSAAGLLAQQANPSDEDIRRLMAGNICRCGTYARIVAAIKQAAEAMRNGAAR